MDSFKILIEGYARYEGKSLLASPTTTLIYSNGLNVLVDPGANSKLLLSALDKEGLTIADIDIVFITHYHPDHMLNIRLFPKSKIFDGDTIYDGDKEDFYSEKIPDTNIEVIPTPGHAFEHVALKLNTKDGVVVIAADVFWWMDGEQKTDSTKVLLDHQDPYAKDEKALGESRRKVLAIADWIIPGHGRMFKKPTKHSN